PHRSTCCLAARMMPVELRTRHLVDACGRVQLRAHVTLIGTSSFAVCGGDAESVPAMTADCDPLVVGSPPIAPVLPLSVMLAGSLPDEIFQCTGARPPADCSCALNAALTFAAAEPPRNCRRPFGNNTQNRGSPPGTTNLTTM